MSGATFHLPISSPVVVGHFDTSLIQDRDEEFGQDVHDAADYYEEGADDDELEDPVDGDAPNRLSGGELSIEIIQSLASQAPPAPAPARKSVSPETRYEPSAPHIEQAD